MKLHEEKIDIEQQIKKFEQDRAKLDSEERQIKNELMQVEDEIQDFQKEKMAKLNILIKIPIVLKINQIQNLEKDEEAFKFHQQQALTKTGNQDNVENPELDLGYFLPKSLINSTLFTKNQLEQLLHRKQLLDKEKEANSNRRREMEIEFDKKKKQIKLKEQELKLMQDAYFEQQMLRFGSTSVDLDQLEVAGPSATVIEL